MAMEIIRMIKILEGKSKAPPPAVAPKPNKGASSTNGDYSNDQHIRGEIEMFGYH